MSRDPPDVDDWFVVTDRKVLADGRRVILPERVSERYGIGEGDVIDVRVYRRYRHGSDDYISVPEALVETQNRIPVPRHQLELRHIGPGDYVDLEIRDTGADYPGEEDED